MLRRLKKVLLSTTALAAIMIALLIVVSVVGQRYRFSSTPSVDNIDIYTLHSDSGDPTTCHRDNSGFTIETNEDGEILNIQPISDQAAMEQCIEAFQSGELPFDPRNFIGHYEAGYVSWEGVDHENIYHWGIPGECAPHYQFKQKSHPWVMDAFGLVDTIEVTFAWTGTDAEWHTCFVARENEIAEIDLSDIEFEVTESSLN